VNTQDRTALIHHSLDYGQIIVWRCLRDPSFSRLGGSPLQLVTRVGPLRTGLEPSTSRPTRGRICVALALALKMRGLGLEDAWPWPWTPCSRTHYI